MYKITWKPSPNVWTGRNTYVPIAIVNHRMVGTLPGTDATFLNPLNNVSCHFGIGRRTAGGPVEISQYVDLRDTAWGNGNYDPSGGWPLIKRSGTGSVINPNYYTVSIEHEDGGSANLGVVSPEVRAASEWLSRIITSGNLELYDLVGIRCSSPAVAEALRSIPIGEETYIDHNRISGVKKPYCWRKWLSDPGFVPEYKPTMMANVKDKGMLISDILDILALEVAKIETERDAALEAAATAEAERDAAIAEAEATKQRLATAKSLAAQIVAV